MRARFPKAAEFPLVPRKSALGTLINSALSRTGSASPNPSSFSSCWTRYPPSPRLLRAQKRQRSYRRCCPVDCSAAAGEARLDPVRRSASVRLDPPHWASTPLLPPQPGPRHAAVSCRWSCRRTRRLLIRSHRSVYCFRADLVVTAHARRTGHSLTTSVAVTGAVSTIVGSPTREALATFGCFSMSPACST